MKASLLWTAALAVALTSAAADAKPRKKGARALPPGVEVLERDAKGRITKIRKDGQELAVCTSDDSDGCINPREAGLGYGNNVATSWPGRPISREN